MISQNYLKIILRIVFHHACVLCNPVYFLSCMKHNDPKEGPQSPPDCHQSLWKCEWCKPPALRFSPNYERLFPCCFKIWGLNKMRELPSKKLCGMPLKLLPQVGGGHLPASPPTSLACPA